MNDKHQGTGPQSNNQDSPSQGGGVPIVQGKVGLVVLNDNLRLYCNRVVERASKESDRLLFVYCLPEAHRDDVQSFQALLRSESQPLSHRRYRYLLESLDDLAKELEALGHRLLVTKLTIEDLIEQLIIELPHITCYLAAPISFNANKALNGIRPELSERLVLVESGGVFLEDQLPFSINELPATFSKFRKIIEKNVDWVLEPSVTKIKPAIVNLPKISSIDVKSELNEVAKNPHLITGGRRAFDRMFQEYLSCLRPLSYKETRNALWGDMVSSKWSLGLAQGIVSPTELMTQLKQFELEHGANESTYWLYFELLWREYFRWYAKCHGVTLFTKSGVSKSAKLTTFYPARFQSWCKGSTPYPLINALMKELNETGYMSNRGRQIAASCLIYDLGVDWRYGASYFEYRLIDYDVASNWGNWQYIAGVGADPKGGRHFNIEKQTALYDPEGEFIARWRGRENVGALDVVDMVDWPIQ